MRTRENHSRALCTIWLNTFICTRTGCASHLGGGLGWCRSRLCLLGRSSFALHTLLLRLCFLGIVGSGALHEASTVEQAGDAVGRQCTDGEPVLAALQVQLHPVLIVLLEHRVEGADLLDVAPIARRRRVGCN